MNEYHFSLDEVAHILRVRSDDIARQFPEATTTETFTIDDVQRLAAKLGIELGSKKDGEGKKRQG